MTPDTFHHCNKCKNLTAKVDSSSDSDGASYTWITWYHNCQNPVCKYQEKKQAQYMYNFEETNTCQICSKEYKT